MNHEINGIGIHIKIHLANIQRQDIHIGDYGKLFLCKRALSGNVHGGGVFKIFDIDQEWFHDNFSNIIELTRQIQIEETGKTRTDSDDVKSHEYLVTIPEGSGDFIWELLGMDAPDYDIRISLYLTGLCRMSRMEVDLSDITKGASMIID